MKLNNKGLTLTELIVSFMLVGVAIVYFFQTLITVNKLYATAREETNDFIERDYALRIADAWADNSIKSCNNGGGSAAEYSYNYTCEDIDKGIIRLEIKKNSQEITYLYKCIK